MASPAMIEGVGVFEPTDIGPVSVHEQNGVVDYVAENEEEQLKLQKNPFLFSRSCKQFLLMIKKFFETSCQKTEDIPMRCGT